ncbi:MAG: type II toxin-antitoxin system HicA family toxin [Boseongicola sp. SB0677_bin_26]|nr:type II toxin-antitoxin system HicA family toxin [Boseongicola sp. SB0665_bin_10]MYG27191.1 type II toxin-antitoxin system HicA family toxin [Boseongicola sp. SB0677_bin_26]
MKECGREFWRLLKSAGWSRARSGSKASHETWQGNVNGTRRSVSVRAKIKSRHPANAILNSTGLGKRF